PTTAATPIPNNLKIIIDSPDASTAISSPVEVLGTASVDRGTVVAVVLDASGAELGRGTATASASKPDYGHFDVSVSFSGAVSGTKGQGRAPLEIVCLDRGSTDGTRHIVSQFPLARFVEIAEPAGAPTWNRAMDEARGDVVVFLAQDAIPANGDWLNHLAAPFEDVSVSGVYGRQQAPLESDPICAFRIGQRFCGEPHWRRNRIGDMVRYKSLPFFIDNAAVRRSVWRGIRFNEHLPIGADRVWARQLVLASCRVAYGTDALGLKVVRVSRK